MCEHVEMFIVIVSDDAIPKLIVYHKIKSFIIIKKKLVEICEEFLLRVKHKISSPKY